MICIHRLLGPVHICILMSHLHAAAPLPSLSSVSIGEGELEAGARLFILEDEAAGPQAGCTVDWVWKENQQSAHAAPTLPHYPEEGRTFREWGLPPYLSMRTLGSGQWPSAWPSKDLNPLLRGRRGQNPPPQTRAVGSTQQTPRTALDPAPLQLPQTATAALPHEVKGRGLGGQGCFTWSPGNKVFLLSLSPSSHHLLSPPPVSRREFTLKAEPWVGCQGVLCG